MLQSPNENALSDFQRMRAPMRARVWAPAVAMVSLLYTLSNWRLGQLQGEGARGV